MSGEGKACTTRFQPYSNLMFADCVKVGIYIVNYTLSFATLCQATKDEIITTTY